MQPLVDSTEHITNFRELRRALARDGYIFLRSVLDRSDLARTVIDFGRILDAGGFAACPTSEEDALVTGLIATRQDLAPADAAYMERYRNFYRTGSMHRIPKNPRLRELVEGIYSEPAIHHPVMLPRIVFPDYGEGVKMTPAHQDYPSTQGSERTLTVWCPLGDYSMTDGTLVIARGRHKEGLFPHGVSIRDVFELARDFSADEVGGTVRAGDLLIFTCFTPHRAAPNLSRRIRLSVDFRFQPVSDPVSDLNFNDYCISPRQSWEEVYCDSDIDEDLRFYWQKVALRYDPHSNAFYDEQVRAAMAYASAGSQAAMNYLRAVSADTVDFNMRERWKALLAETDGRPR